MEASLSKRAAVSFSSGRGGVFVVARYPFAREAKSLIPITINYYPSITNLVFDHMLRKRMNGENEL